MEIKKQNRLIFNKQSYYQNNNGYVLLPFSFTSHDAENYILSNDYGEYLLIKRNQLQSVVNKTLTPTDTLYNELKSKFFIADNINEDLLNLLATKFRTKKSFLYNFTGLHIFVVTLRCDHSCHYCQVSRQNVNNTKYDMSNESADRAVDLVFKSQSKSIKIEFQGGESMLNFPLIKRIVLRAIELNQNFAKDLGFVIATNLSNITDDQLEFCRLYNINLSSSLDGPPTIHNANRPIGTRDSYQRFARNLDRARTKLGYGNVAALMTTTNLSLMHPKEIVDEYVKLGFRQIFLRAISPYGFAVKSKSTSNYETEKFIEFYKTALNHILDYNLNGRQLVEGYAELILKKILTPFATTFVDLQSPAGMGIGAVVYNYDGRVYASDESRMLAEMKDKNFCIGDLLTDDYEQIFTNPVLVDTIRNSVNETLPKCSDCAYRPYCGSDPVFNYSRQGDVIGHKPTSNFCKKNMAIIKFLINKIESADENLMNVFYSWINRRSLKDIKTFSAPI